MTHRLPKPIDQTARMLLAATLFAAAPRAVAEVIEIDASGAAFVRSDAGPVEWQVIGSEQAPAVDAPVPAPAALTLVEGSLAPAVFTPSLLRAAELAGVSPALLEALVWQESRWRVNAVSSAGAVGLGQLMPGTARVLGVDPRDPHANLLGAARYLRQQLDRFDNNVELALAAYNAGPRRVEKAGGIPPIAETRAYVAAITGRLSASATTP